MIVGGAVLAVGVTLLAALLWAGYVREGWAAHYLDDGEPGTWLTAGGLAVAGLLSLVTAARSGRVGGRRFWCIVAFTLFAVAADDFCRIHENVDLKIHALFGADPKHPLTDRLDDLIIAAYGLFACWHGWRHRHELVRRPWAAYCLGIALALFAAMVACDVSHVSQTVEDTFKTLSVLFIVNGLLAAALCRTEAA